MGLVWMFPITAVSKPVIPPTERSAMHIGLSNTPYVTAWTGRVFPAPNTNAVILPSHYQVSPPSRTLQRSSRSTTECADGTGDEEWWLYSCAQPVSELDVCRYMNAYVFCVVPVFMCFASNKYRSPPRCPQLRQPCASRPTLLESPKSKKGRSRCCSSAKHKTCAAKTRANGSPVPKTDDALK